MFVMYHCELWDWTMGILNFCSKKVYRVPEYDVANLVIRYFEKSDFGVWGINAISLDSQSCREHFSLILET